MGDVFSTLPLDTELASHFGDDDENDACSFSTPQNRVEGRHVILFCVGGLGNVKEDFEKITCAIARMATARDTSPTIFAPLVNMGSRKDE